MPCPGYHHCTRRTFSIAKSRSYYQTHVKDTQNSQRACRYSLARERLRAFGESLGPFRCLWLYQGCT
jgi:hypothetical protein